jgi:hypothetical protein
MLKHNAAGVCTDREGVIKYHKFHSDFDDKDYHYISGKRDLEPNILYLGKLWHFNGIRTTIKSQASLIQDYRRSSFMNFYSQHTGIVRVLSKWLLMARPIFLYNSPQISGSRTRRFFISERKSHHFIREEEKIFYVILKHNCTVKHVWGGDSVA